MGVDFPLAVYIHPKNSRLFPLKDLYIAVLLILHSSGLFMTQSNPLTLERDKPYCFT